MYYVYTPVALQNLPCLKPKSAHLTGAVLVLFLFLFALTLPHALFLLRRLFQKLSGKTLHSIRI